MLFTVHDLLTDVAFLVYIMRIMCIMSLSDARGDPTPTGTFHVELSACNPASPCTHTAAFLPAKSARPNTAFCWHSTGTRVTERILLRLICRCKRTFCLLHPRHQPEQLHAGLADTEYRTHRSGKCMCKGPEWVCPAAATNKK